MIRPDHNGWQKAWHMRAMYPRVRAWLCTQVCDGYDRNAGRIIDGLVAENDQLRDELAKLRARAGSPA